MQTDPLQLRIRAPGFRTLPGAASVAAALARRGAAAPHGGNPWPTVDAGIHDANDDNDDSEVMMPRMLMMILMIMMKSVSDSP